MLDGSFCSTYVVAVGFNSAWNYLSLKFCHSPPQMVLDLNEWSYQS